MPAATAPNIDAVLYHTGFGGGMNRRGDVRGRLRAQAEGLAKVQERSGKPMIVAIRPSSDPEGFDHTLEFEDLCWRNELAVFAGIKQAGDALGRLIQWQNYRQ